MPISRYRRADYNTGRLLDLWCYSGHIFETKIVILVQMFQILPLLVAENFRPTHEKHNLGCFVNTVKTRTYENES